MTAKNPERILVVDDDPLSRKLLAARTFPRPVISAANVRVAKKRYDSCTPKSHRLLLLDFDMPGLNGAEVLKQLRADSDPAIAQIPTIMLTGHGRRGE